MGRYKPDEYWSDYVSLEHWFNLVWLFDMPLANIFARLLSFTLVSTTVLAQLSGSVGPSTPLSEKQGTICNVLDYGGSVGSSVSFGDFYPK